MSQATSNGDFLALMRRLREGSEEAATELLTRYGEHILRVVRLRLNRRLRSQFDSADFVQAVWASFFAGAPVLGSFHCPEALLAFLATLARNKVIEVVRQKLHTRKYDLRREQSLDTPAANNVVARQPTPSQLAVANDEWDNLIRDLPRHYQRILTLLREGHTQREVAAELGLNEKTIRRLLDKLDAEPAA